MVQAYRCAAALAGHTLGIGCRPEIVYRAFQEVAWALENGKSACGIEINA